MTTDNNEKRQRIIAKKREKERTATQNAQARLVLIQLLWLVIGLLVGLMAWLYHNQKSLHAYTQERLKFAETFNTRMNELDDRIFALKAEEMGEHPKAVVKNDAMLVRLWLGRVDGLYQNGQYGEARQVLSEVRWQLGHDRLALAAPLKTALKSAIDDDIAQINILKNQGDAWTEQGIILHQIQSYIKTQNIGSDSQKAQVRDIHMLLSFAQAAILMRSRQTQEIYLQEILYKLNYLDNHLSADGVSVDAQNNEANNSINVSSIAEAVTKINQLLANKPVLIPLKSSSIIGAEHQS